MTDLAAGWAFADPSIELGRPVLDGKILQDIAVRIPLKMINRHGLVAGATGTGKTRTLQVMADRLSAAGVPVFLPDVKGDLSGMAAAGSDVAAARMKELALEWNPSANPVEFLSFDGKRGAAVRATPATFGPVLLAKALGLNETQESVLSLVFRWCDDRDLALLDCKDLRTALAHLRENAGEVAPEYGEISAATVNVILRKILDLEDEGGRELFGEPEFEPGDLLRVANGRGVVTILNAMDVQNQPRVFATFLMGLLSGLYETLPEVGDLDKPKLVFFFDEAHLLFSDASAEFLDRVQRMIRLIRSKGVGVFFVTQNPTDVPDEILGQLGTRIQHALRAYTPKDRKAVKAMAETFPDSAMWDVEAMLTQTAAGEALVSVVGPTGAPLPTVVARIAAPNSSMTPLAGDALAAAIAGGTLVAKYAAAVDRESASEVLGRGESVPAAPAAAAAPAEPEPPKWKRTLSDADEAIENAARAMAGLDAPAPKPPSMSDTVSDPASEKEPTLLDEFLGDALSSIPAARRQLKKGAAPRSITDDVLRTASREITRNIVRGLFGTRRR